MKYIFTTILILSFSGIAVFGLMEFSHASHTPEAPMVNCPYADNSYSICKNTFNHIENWRQFSNVIIPSLFIFSLLVLGVVLFLFNKQGLLNQRRYFYKWKYYLYDQKLYTYKERIIKWLSLFENSPSLSY